jgi:hypothetical protein
LLSNTQWSDNNESWSTYAGFYDYGYYGSVSAVVRTRNTLSLLESGYSYDGVNSTEKVRLRVIDLRDPAHVTTSVLPLPVTESTAYAGLLADGEVVMTSHFESTSADNTRGRFYIDRFSISDPGTPKRLESINVPGALMSFDGASQRAITSEQVRVKVSDVTSDVCYQRFANASWTDPRGGIGYPTLSVGAGMGTKSAGKAGASASDIAEPIPEQPNGECLGYVQRLHLVHVEPGVATLEDTYALAESEQVYSSSTGDGLLFASLGRGYGYLRGPVADVACFGACGGAPSEPSELLVLGGFDRGKLSVGHVSVADSAQSNPWWGFWGSPSVYASGKRALLVGSSDIAIIEASDPSQPAIRERVPLIAAAQYLDVHPDVALLSLGQQGVQWLELKP